MPTAITKLSYRQHKMGRRGFPTYEQYVANTQAAHEAGRRYSAIVASVKLASGQTLGQIFWANSTIERAAIEAAVFQQCEVIGYQAGSGAEVYGLKEQRR